MPNEVEQLKERVEMLENIINSFILNGSYTFQKDVRLLEGKNIYLGTSKGTKVGTAATQKIGFFGVTPVVQQSSITAPTGGGTIDGPARTAIGTIITTLQTLGLTA